MFSRLLRSIGRALAQAVSSSPSRLPSIAVVPRVTHCERHSQNVIRNFLFAQWIDRTVKTTRFRYGNTVQSLIGNRRKPISLIFGLGFCSLNEDQAPESGSYVSSTKHLLQELLKTSFESIPKESSLHSEKSFNDYVINHDRRLGKRSSQSAVYEAKIDNNKYAIKMLFNYHAKSNSISLLKAFSKELAVISDIDVENVEGTSKYTRLPPHFNVMRILNYFNDNMLVCPDSVKDYPAALPPSRHKYGCGHNRTMYHVMPRFSGTLEDFIEKHDNLSLKSRLALFAQLVEGIHHLNEHKVAHRDLKIDNILVNEGEGDFHHLLIADFDCCFAEKDHGLIMPYVTDETCKGGNIMLMAPEVEFAEAGPDSKIDYSKADEWAAATLAYDIFGESNPFVNMAVDKNDIKDLPLLKNAPKSIQILVKNLLQRHPNDRPTPSVAATVIQIQLWAPNLFHCAYNEPSVLRVFVKDWFEKEICSLIFEFNNQQNSGFLNQENIPVDKQILCNFLSRVSIDEIIEAIEWLKRHIDDI